MDYKRKIIGMSILRIPFKKFMNNLSETWHGFKYIDYGPDGNLYLYVEFQQYMFR